MKIYRLKVFTIYWGIFDMVALMPFAYSSWQLKHPKNYTLIIKSSIPQSYVPMQSENSFCCFQNSILVLVETYQQNVVNKCSQLVSCFNGSYKNRYRGDRYGYSTGKAIVSGGKADKNIELSVAFRQNSILFFITRIQRRYHSLFHTKLSVEHGCYSFYLQRFYHNISSGYLSVDFMRAIKNLQHFLGLHKQANMLSYSDIMYRLKANIVEYYANKGKRVLLAAQLIQLPLQKLS